MANRKWHWVNIKLGKHQSVWRATALVLALSLSLSLSLATPASAAPAWMNQALTPGTRASLLEAKMSEAQKFSLLHGNFALYFYYAGFSGKTIAPIPGALGGSGYVPGIAALNIPPLQETDGGEGIAIPTDEAAHQGATPLAANLGLAASFNPAMAQAVGQMLGQQAWQRGFNVLLAGGVNLARDPRNGRNYEYLGEDPLLAGTLDGAMIAGIQSRHVIATLKHFAFNDQETNRQSANAVINEAQARESDLLAFELALEGGHPGAVMCAYNQLNGTYACANPALLNGVLKHDWHYPGWVMSDWGAVHSATDATAGLDQESGAELDPQIYFAAPLQTAVQNGAVPQARINAMVHRILRSMFAVGLFNHPPVPAPLNLTAGAALVRQEEDEAIVLLRNQGNILPLSPGLARIAVIGGLANAGVLSGGGSSQVIPPTQAPFLPAVLMGQGLAGAATRAIYNPNPPLAAIQAAAPNAEIKYNPGTTPQTAAQLARWANVVVVLATKWQTESQDSTSLALPNGQNALISAVAKANPHVVVVLQTGNPVLMPWLGQTAGVLEAWYPGGAGGQAIADILFGKSNPSGHLPITFPAAANQLPRPVIPGQFPGALTPGAITQVDYNIEGAAVGYRWYAARGLRPLFPFGFGLSYTSFTLSHLRLSHPALGATPGAPAPVLQATFEVTNTGTRPGATVAQLYLQQRGGKKLLRLLGFARVTLEPGETELLTLTPDPRLLADYSTKAHGWLLPAAHYRLGLGSSALDMAASAEMALPAAQFAP